MLKKLLSILSMGLILNSSLINGSAQSSDEEWSDGQELEGEINQTINNANKAGQPDEAIMQENDLLKHNLKELQEQREKLIKDHENKSKELEKKIMALQSLEAQFEAQVSQNATVNEKLAQLTQVKEQEKNAFEEKVQNLEELNRNLKDQVAVADKTLNEIDNLGEAKASEKEKLEELIASLNVDLTQKNTEINQKDIKIAKNRTWFMPFIASSVAAASFGLAYIYEHLKLSVKSKTKKRDLKK